MNKEEAKKIFGANLKKIRISKGVSQEELAKALGYINRSSINKIEVGRSDMPRSKITLAAKYLNVSPLEFFKEEEFTDKYLDVVVDQQLVEIENQYGQLNEKNRMKLSAYIQALIDSQEE